MKESLKEKAYRTIRNKLTGKDMGNWYRGGLPLITNDDANATISKAIQSATPYMIARLGSVEIKPLLYYSELKHFQTSKLRKLYFAGDIDYIFDKEKYDSYMADILHNNAGFFPKKTELLGAFADRMLQDIGEMDLCGAWLNEYLLRDKFKKNTLFCELGALEPYDYATPWTESLTGKKVLVIHPFTSTIEKQFNQREKIWANPMILPAFSLSTIRAVQSIAGETVTYDTWFSALEDMERNMDNLDYDVALIGCGAYGLPLAAHAKRTGHIGIHLGGPLQILFGIKGRRWDNIPSVSRYYNEYWVRPSENETPERNHVVENGCYW